MLTVKHNLQKHEKIQNRKTNTKHRHKKAEK